MKVKLNDRVVEFPLALLSAITGKLKRARRRRGAQRAPLVPLSACLLAHASVYSFVV